MGGEQAEPVLADGGVDDARGGGADGGEEAPLDCACDCDGGRRAVLKACIGVMTVVSAGMVGFPVVAFLARPESMDLDKPLEVPLDGLGPGQAKYLELRGQQLILLAGKAGPTVFNASCPHLGCNVIWASGEGVFHCPCHGAAFDAGGQVIRGPVSAPLRKVPFARKGGALVITSTEG